MCIGEQEMHHAGDWRGADANVLLAAPAFQASRDRRPEEREGSREPERSRSERLAALAETT